MPWSPSDQSPARPARRPLAAERDRARSPSGVPTGLMGPCGGRWFESVAAHDDNSWDSLDIVRGIGRKRNR
jgi:hypothetical protein